MAVYDPHDKEVYVDSDFYNGLGFVGYVTTIDGGGNVVAQILEPGTTSQIPWGMVYADSTGQIFVADPQSATVFGINS
jgi:DNA-binding beta-propeller fold protein YncE